MKGLFESFGARSCGTNRRCSIPRSALQLGVVLVAACAGDASSSRTTGEPAVAAREKTGGSVSGQSGNASIPGGNNGVGQSGSASSMGGSGGASTGAQPP